jgi:hypothetical protein
MKEKLAFTIGTGAALMGVALVADGVARVQTGPWWEVPAAAATNWFWFRFISLVLYCIAVFSYYRGDRLTSMSRSSRRSFRILLCVGFLTSILSYVFDPEQWRIIQPNLSALARGSSTPTYAICGLVWILLIVRTRKSPSSM